MLKRILTAVKWSHFLTGRDDATVFRVSFLSRPREWHALMVGVIAYLAPQLLVPLGLPPEVTAALGPAGAATYVAGRSMKDLARTLAGQLENTHVKDALQEPAYVAGAYGVLWAVDHAVALLGGGL